MLTIETLRKNAIKFTKAFADASYELGQAQSFIIELCKVFDLDYIRAVRFEDRVKTAKGKGRIDAFFPGLLLVEMKSAGKDLDEAYTQATDYFHGLKDDDLPRCVLVSDFQNLHLYNQETKAEPLKIKLAELPQYIERFRFLTGYKKIATERQERINKEAAEKMADLHDAMKATGYEGKDLETYLVRLLFCLFANDTGLFGENGTFLNYLHNYTKTDGFDLHCALDLLFDSLNRNDADRIKIKTFPEHLKQFPYINGSLFEGYIRPCYFDEQMRSLLLDCAKLDWSEISPAIFGTLFQAVMHFEDEQPTAKTKKRREFGAHYTSEENILKVINPLFMDDLRAEFEKCRRTKAQLTHFHTKLSQLKFFDPACGCGNFLVIAYRELRLLELEVIKALWKSDLIMQMDVSTLILCNVDNFYGIDIDESAVNIATLAMWLTNHQMNLKVQELGHYYHRIPLTTKANIELGNALQMDWENLIAPRECNFIMGNPPFRGSSYQSTKQKQDLAEVFRGIRGAGVLDYVLGWFIKAAHYIQKNKYISVAFVSTNSITQGEQVGVLWAELEKLHIKLQFAHRTFKWTNEGRGVAAVHCVILGFGLQERESYRLFDYSGDIKGQPIELKASTINPYLVDSYPVLLMKRASPISPNVPEMIFGSKPTDGGHLLLSPEEAETIKQQDPIAAKYIRPFLGADEFINNIPRYCLWLKDCDLQDLKQSPEIKKRMDAVKKMRLASQKLPTQKLAESSHLFGEIRQTDQPYLLIPAVSSETRRFIPIGYLSGDVICSNANFMLPNASLFDFGMLCSTMHNAWLRAVCGRLKSDYRYSNTIVYNNFPFPQKIKPTQKQRIETAAQAILEARQFEEKRCAEGSCSLALLYDSFVMPVELIKAHNELDKAVDAAYGYKGGKDDAARVAFLFELYQKLTSPLMESEPAKKTRKSAEK